MSDELKNGQDSMLSAQSEGKEVTSQNETSTPERSEAPLEGELVADEALEEHRNLPGSVGEMIVPPKATGIRKLFLHKWLWFVAERGSHTRRSAGDR